MINKKLESLADKIIQNPSYRITEQEADMLLSIRKSEINEMVFLAGKIREQYKGNKIFCCSIINAKSGQCSENCAYCAQSAHHKTGAPVFDMREPDVILETALRLEDSGATHYSMVTSGFSPAEGDLEKVCTAARNIREKTDLRVCASLGVLTPDMAKKLKQSGISNYHHNLETAESHFDQVCTTHEYSDDINTVKAAKEAGFVVCSGGIMGLGESWKQRFELAMTLKELDVDTIPLNFLNPVPGTPLADRPLLSAMDALKCIALFRFIHPEKNITICGGREVALKDFQSWIFKAGANALMSGDYLTTEGRSIKEDMEMIAQMNLIIDAD